MKINITMEVGAVVLIPNLKSCVLTNWHTLPINE